MNTIFKGRSVLSVMSRGYSVDSIFLSGHHLSQGNGSWSVRSAPRATATRKRPKRRLRNTPVVAFCRLNLRRGSSSLQDQTRRQVGGKRHNHVGSVREQGGTTSASLNATTVDTEGFDIQFHDPRDSNTHPRDEAGVHYC